VNPDKSDRNKDQWDYAELDDKERSAFKFVIFKFMELGFQNVKIFENKFDAESIETLKNYIND
jgi:hypothetical protein